MAPVLHVSVVQRHGRTDLPVSLPLVFLTSVVPPLQLKGHFNAFA